MKIFLIALITSISFLSYGQENAIHSIAIEWEQLSAPLSVAKKELKTEKYQLLEVNLTIDLREQYLRKNTSIMYLPPNQFVQSKYNVAIPQPKTSKMGFTVSGNGNTNLNTTGRIKNIAYKDASLYSGAFCPITGLAY